MSEQQIEDRLLAQEEFLKKVQEERVKQNLKWGWQSHDGPKYYIILMEEIGELARGILEHRKENTTEEMVHSAAVLCAMYEQHVNDRSLS